MDILITLLPLTVRWLLDRLLGARTVAGVGQTLIEYHRNVGSNHLLHRHRFLRTKEELMSVDVRIEKTPVFRQLAHLRKRKDLKSAGIRQDWTVPPHEPVKPARRGDHLRAGPQHQMIGVPEDDLRLRLDKVARLQGLHGPLRSDIHENRRLHRPMGGVETSKPRLRAQILFDHLETHGAYSTKKYQFPLA